MLSEVGSGASWEVKPRSAAACVLLRVTWYELQSDLQMVATSVGLGAA